MNVSCKAENCVLVSKKETLGKEGKKYYTIGISQNRSDVAEFSVSEEIYKSVTENLFYKPVLVLLQYRETKNYGSFFQVSDIIVEKPDKV